MTRTDPTGTRIFVNGPANFRANGIVKEAGFSYRFFEKAAVTPTLAVDS